ncbi:hypothetical protein RND81_14G238500 [Saponaria officinalis]|uniref:Uncharacterized protein n=1 Tax=Saponaria officinalis TaxID=3572 RepID=A0AAW1GZN2_SAPOF
MKKSKTKKLGGFVSGKAAKLLDLFKAKKTIIQETQLDTPIDDNSLYYEVVGGHDRKGRVYGVGTATPLYYQKTRRSDVGTGGSGYTPGVMTRLTQENQQLQERMAEMEQWREEMSQSQRFDPTAPTCNPNNFFGDNFFDDGGSGGGGGDFSVPLNASS